MRTIFIICCLVTLLTSCSSQKPHLSDSAPDIHPHGIENTPDAIPRIEPKSRGGNPASYTVFGKRYYVMDSSHGFTQRGTASWYGTKFHGNKTSNGETYDMYAMTAAHKSLPLPSYVEVTNLSTGKKIIVRVNDRGPFHGGRIIDLSYAAAAKLGTLKKGTSTVEIRVVSPPSGDLTTLDSPPDTLFVKKNNAPHKTPVFTETPLTKKGHVFIQVGAFSSLEIASKLKKQLELALKKMVSIKVQTRANKTLFIVRVGPYLDVNSAHPTRIKLNELGFTDVLYAKN
tara:strand:- start:11274 stop:12128 length:855 start_codon:yes stop_codon:yes gene_type:complete